MLAAPDAPETTVDRFLGGRVEAVQPAAGHHRAGLDAVLLAASIEAAAGDRAVDLGAGAGVAGMALAARLAGVAVTLAELDAELVECAATALARPGNGGFAGRVDIVRADILAEASRRDAGLAPSSFDHALMNPPFHDAALVRASPKVERARAHVLAEGGLDPWFRAAAALVRPGGTLSVILPAARLGDLFASSAGRFGRLIVLPVHPRPGEAAIRIIAAGVKGSRAAPALLPGLVLHGAAGSAFSPAAAALLADGAGLADVLSSWPSGAASRRAASSNPDSPL